MLPCAWAHVHAVACARVLHSGPQRPLGNHPCTDKAPTAAGPCECSPLPPSHSTPRRCSSAAAVPRANATAQVVRPAVKGREEPAVCVGQGELGNESALGRMGGCKIFGCCGPIFCPSKPLRPPGNPGFPLCRPAPHLQIHTKTAAGAGLPQALAGLGSNGPQAGQEQLFCTLYM